MAGYYACGAFIQYTMDTVYKELGSLIGENGTTSNFFEISLQWKIKNSACKISYFNAFKLLSLPWQRIDFFNGNRKIYYNNKITMYS